ncbi:ATPase [Arenimonas soli]|uniref:ATPase n=1 Tax=Arenimonas soli TaxID=2269504 RepID=A0ABQ1HHA0_9GAMM|nr:SRPBCC domain-containing protein [Arenimonas soli]GGA76110.1 ATPase [Arenimonas soli]
MARTTLQADLAERQVILTRDFKAPRELVFRAFTDSAALARWWGPHGFQTEIVENQARAGGSYHFVMRDAEGNAYPVQGKYTEVTPPSRLVMTDDCSCMPPEWLEKYAAEEIARGETILNTSVTTFEDLGDGRTRMRMQITCTSNRLRDGLVEAGMNDGWGESFEKLDAVLETP